MFKTIFSRQFITALVLGTLIASSPLEAAAQHRAPRHNQSCFQRSVQGARKIGSAIRYGSAATANRVGTALKNQFFKILGKRPSPATLENAAQGVALVIGLAGAAAGAATGTFIALDFPKTIVLASAGASSALIHISKSLRGKLLYQYIALRMLSLLPALVNYMILTIGIEAEFDLSIISRVCALITIFPVYKLMRSITAHMNIEVYSGAYILLLMVGMILLAPIPIPIPIPIIETIPAILMMSLAILFDFLRPHNPLCLDIQDLVNRLHQYHLLDTIHLADYLNGGQCIICWEIPLPMNSLLLPCGHIYHETCINNSFAMDRQHNRPRQCPSKCVPIPKYGKRFLVPRELKYTPLN